MRDSKILFREKADPSTASKAVDMGGSEPGIGRRAMFDATYDSTGSTAPTGDVTVTITGSDTEAGTYVTVDTLTIPQAVAGAGGVILSTPVPATALRFLKTTWSGLTGGAMTDGISCQGLRSGTPAKAPYLY